MSGLSPLSDSRSVGFPHSGLVDQTKLSGRNVSLIFVIVKKEIRTLSVL